MIPDIKSPRDAKSQAANLRKKPDLADVAVSKRILLSTDFLELHPGLTKVFVRPSGSTALP